MGYLYLNVKLSPNDEVCNSEKTGVVEYPKTGVLEYWSVGNGSRQAK